MDLEASITCSCHGCLVLTFTVFSWGFFFFPPTSSFLFLKRLANEALMQSLLQSVDFMRIEPHWS